MIDTLVVLVLIWIHFFADFVLQTDKVAKEKSSNIEVLTFHCILYTIPLMAVSQSWLFLAFNGMAHFVTDFFTSKATTWLYKREQRHWFFVVIGLDQAIHLTTLVLSYMILVY